MEWRLRPHYATVIYGVTYTKHLASTAVAAFPMRCLSVVKILQILEIDLSSSRYPGYAFAEVAIMISCSDIGWFSGP